MAFAPDLATAAALPASQVLNRTSGSPVTWSRTKSSNLLMGIGCLRWSDHYAAADGLRLPNSCDQHPSLAYGCSGHLGQGRHQRAVREGAVTDPCDTRISPNLLVRGARERNDVERQRHLAHDPLDLLGVREARHEEAARACLGERLPALDHLVDQSIVVRLRLQEQVGPRVDV